MDSKDMVAIVTGGEKGIGRGITEEFLSRGMRVCIAGIDKEAADRALSDLKAGPSLIFRETDVSDEKAVAGMVRETVKEFGALHTVIANAGLAAAHGQAVETLDIEKWNRIIAVNLTGTFLCAKYAFPELRKTRGSMVLISSTRALQSMPDGVAYSASKGGIFSLAHSLAMSGGPEIRVNAISPGWIHHGDPSKLSESNHRVHPVGRVGTPADIAKMAAYLVSEEASFITGQNFVVDGGMTRKMSYK